MFVYVYVGSKSGFFMFSISHSKPPQGLAETKQQLGDTRQARFWCAQLIKTSLGFTTRKDTQNNGKKTREQSVVMSYYLQLFHINPIIIYDYPC